MLKSAKSLVLSLSLAKPNAMVLRTRLDTTGFPDGVEGS